MKKYISVFFILFLIATELVNGQNYIISTIAGNGTEGYSGNGGPAVSAQLDEPNEIAVDDSGNLYIADEESNCIRKVTTGGIISSYAGDSVSGYSGDGGNCSLAKLAFPTAVAFDHSGNCYIADAGNNLVRKVDKSGTIFTLAGNGIVGYTGDNGPAIKAEFFYPFGLAADDSGNVYVADWGNNVIREVKANGNISTFAGNGVLGFSGDGGPATAAELNGPTGVAVDRHGNVYFAENGSNRIRKVNTKGIISTIAGNGIGGYSGDGSLAINAEIDTATTIVVDNSGNIYIADVKNARIRKVDSNGVITTIAGNGNIGYYGDGGAATSAMLQYPDGVAIDATGHIYISDGETDVIRKLTPTTGVVPVVTNYAQIQISPNPCRTTTMVYCAGFRMNEIVIESTLGRILLEMPNINAVKEPIDVASLPSGFYIIKVVLDNETMTGKLVVTR